MRNQLFQPHNVEQIAFKDVYPYRTFQNASLFIAYLLHIYYTVGDFAVPLRLKNNGLLFCFHRYRKKGYLFFGSSICMILRVGGVMSFAVSQQYRSQCGVGLIKPGFISPCDHIHFIFSSSYGDVCSERISDWITM